MLNSNYFLLVFKFWRSDTFDNVSSCQIFIDPPNLEKDELFYGSPQISMATFQFMTLLERQMAAGEGFEPPSRFRADTQDFKSRPL